MKEGQKRYSFRENEVWYGKVEENTPPKYWNNDYKNEENGFGFVSATKNSVAVSQGCEMEHASALDMKADDKRILNEMTILNNNSTRKKKDINNISIIFKRFRTIYTILKTFLTNFGQLFLRCSFGDNANIEKSTTRILFGDCNDDESSGYDHGYDDNQNEKEDGIIVRYYLNNINKNMMKTIRGIIFSIDMEKNKR